MDQDKMCAGRGRGTVPLDHIGTRSVVRNGVVMASLDDTAAAVAESYGKEALGGAIEMKNMNWEFNPEKLIDEQRIVAFSDGIMTSYAVLPDDMSMDEAFRDYASGYDTGDAEWDISITGLIYDSLESINDDDVSERDRYTIVPQGAKS